MCPYLSQRCKQEHTLLEGMELRSPGPGGATGHRVFPNPLPRCTQPSQFVRFQLIATACGGSAPPVFSPAESEVRYFGALGLLGC